VQITDSCGKEGMTQL